MPEEVKINPNVIAAIATVRLTFADSATETLASAQGRHTRTCTFKPQKHFSVY